MVIFMFVKDMGLSIASKIITLHGGKILVETEKGIGTTFTVKLPKNKM